MDISIALEVISYLNTEFDSHDFIRKLGGIWSVSC